MLNQEQFFAYFFLRPGLYYSNVIGVFIQLLGLLLLFLSHRMNIYTICGLTSFTEVSVFMYRLSVVLLSVCHERNKNHVK